MILSQCSNVDDLLEQKEQEQKDIEEILKAKGLTELLLKAVATGTLYTRDAYSEEKIN